MSERDTNLEQFKANTIGLKDICFIWSEFDGDGILLKYKFEFRQAVIDKLVSLGAKIKPHWVIRGEQSHTGDVIFVDNDGFINSYPSGGQMGTAQSIINIIRRKPLYSKDFLKAN